MARDLLFPAQIVPVPTVREADGLAMSSRNAYLSPADRQAAPILYQALLAAQTLSKLGEKRSLMLLAEVNRRLAEAPEVKVQYVELRDAETLEELGATVDRPAVLALAAYIGRTRLIDNVIISVP
jgi:pantoate--beta-alanine ligase